MMHFKKNYFIPPKNVKVTFIEFHDYKFSKVISKTFFFQVSQPRVVHVVDNDGPAHKHVMLPALLSCLFCFWPLGCCAVISACKVMIG